MDITAERPSQPTAPKTFVTVVYEVTDPDASLTTPPVTPPPGHRYARLRQGDSVADLERLTDQIANVWLTLTTAR